MSQMPPPMGPQPTYIPSGMPGGSPTNKSAVASLVLGLLGCIPWVAGLLAIVFGVIGMRRAERRNHARPGHGRRRSGAGNCERRGLVAVWRRHRGAFDWHRSGAGCGEAVHSRPGCSERRCRRRRVHRRYRPRWLPGDFRQDASLGALQDITVNNVSANINNGVKTTVVGGTATFVGGPMTFSMGLIKQNNQWKVQGMNYDASTKK